MGKYTCIGHRLGVIGEGFGPKERGGPPFGTICVVGVQRCLSIGTGPKLLLSNGCGFTTCNRCAEGCIFEGGVAVGLFVEDEARGGIGGGACGGGIGKALGSSGRGGGDGGVDAIGKHTERAIQGGSGGWRGAGVGGRGLCMSHPTHTVCVRRSETLGVS